MLAARAGLRLGLIATRTGHHAPTGGVRLRSEPDHAVGTGAVTATRCCQVVAFTVGVVHLARPTILGLILTTSVAIGDLVVVTNRRPHLAFSVVHVLIVVTGLGLGFAVAVIEILVVVAMLPIPAALLTITRGRTHTGGGATDCWPRGSLWWRLTPILNVAVGANERWIIEPVERAPPV